MALGATIVVACSSELEPSFGAPTPTQTVTPTATPSPTPSSTPDFGDGHDGALTIATARQEDLCTRVTALDSSQSFVDVTDSTHLVAGRRFVVIQMREPQTNFSSGVQ